MRFTGNWKKTPNNFEKIPLTPIIATRPRLRAGCLFQTRELRLLVVVLEDDLLYFLAAVLRVLSVC